MQPLFLDPMKFPTAGAHVAEIVKAGVITRSMVVIVLVDDAQRGELMRQHATDRGGVFLPCEHWKTDKQFLAALAGVVGVSQTGIAYDLLHRIIDTLNADPRPLFLDHAERLKPSIFGDIRSIYDQADVLIVMAGVPVKLFDLTDDTQRDGTFWSRCVFRDIDAAMREDRESGGQPHDGAGVVGKIGRDQGDGGDV